MDGDYILLPLEKNYTPDIFWLDNNKKIMLSGFHIGTVLLDVQSPDKQELVNAGYFGASENKKEKKIIFNAKENKVYIYEIESGESKEIYTTHYGATPIPKMHLQAIWGVNDKIFFDDLVLENMKLDEHGNDTYDPKYSIIKYNLETEKTEKFIEHGYILNESPDKRYLAYVDETKQKTIILDLTNNKSFEIPLSVELDWTPDSQQFAYIPRNSKQIYIENLEEQGRVVKKLDISPLLSKSKDVLNLQYDHNGYYTFDIAYFDFIDKFNSKFYKEFETYKIKM